MTRHLALIAAAAITGAACATLDRTSPPPPPVTPDQPAEVTTAERGVIPVGQQLDVRLQDRLSSESASVEQRVETTTVVDLMQDGRVLVPAGSVVRGVVRSVDPAGRVDRTASMTLRFDELTVRGRTFPITAMPVGAFEAGGIRDEAATVGAGGAVGAIVGGIIGGVKGALIGAAVGAGGVVAATEGKDVVLPAGTMIRLRMDRPVDVG